MVTLDIDDALNNCGRFVNQNGSLDINQVGAQVCISVIIEEFLLSNFELVPLSEFDLILLHILHNEMWSEAEFGTISTFYCKNSQE